MTAKTAHIPGLTGLRGVAVAAVVAYHLGYLPGGFLGVDVFFALSGFLITSLLLASTPASPRELARWWGRRFTRLTPAVAVVVVAVLVAFATRSGVVADAGATLTWWQNWHLIFEGQPYWASSPSPLRHAWSLSIEEQFYAFWPLTLVFSLMLGRKLRPGRPQLVVAAVAIIGSLASFAWAFHLALEGNAALSRIYFGTDSRIGTLLLGCATAALLHGRSVKIPGWLATGGSAVSLLGLGALTVLATPETRWTYTGGLLAAAFLSLALVIGSTKDGPFATALSWAPLQWLGTRSYALYLWSWPTQVLLEERLPNLAKPLVALTTVAASMVLAEVSLRLVEDPLRRRTSWALNPKPRRAAYLGGAIAIIILLAFAGSSTKPTAVETVAKQFEQLPDPTTTTSTTCPPTPPTTAPAFADQSYEFDPLTVVTAQDPSAPVCGVNTVTRVLVVGDSLGRGAANGLRRLNDPGLEVWDRTVIGCGMQPASAECPDRHETWPAAVAQIDPDVVVVYLRTVDDLVPENDPPFLTPEAESIRRNEMVDATMALSSAGARVMWALPAAPLDIGAFYCDGRHSDSPCDPVWVARWRDDVTAAAAIAGASTFNVQAWVDARPPEGARTDRPDGLHLSGAALDAHAAWLADQIHHLTGANR
ncbi:MAG TPA: acyltransferase family protein [Microthrixaceae bacterium]|nr:acyltransferase family protein [Microthrixaceae bacterium]